MTEAIRKIKSEPVDLSELEAKIIELCEKRTTAINNQLLDSEIPIGDKNQKVAALNNLLSQGKLEVLKQGKQFVYRLKDPQTAGKCRGADNEDKLIYQIIKDADNKGIWSRDIRYKSNLQLTQVNKILKNLESKKLIKAVKSVSASKKKVYMLYDLEPDRTVTGGAWYSDQDFESEFVEVLNQQCYRFLQSRANKAKENAFDPLSQRNASYSSSLEIWKYITELRISKIELGIEDIESILNTLIFDGKVEKLVVSAASENTKNMFRAVEPILSSTGLMRMPCGVCQVFDDCHEGGITSPSTCQYMKEWLDY